MDNIFLDCHYTNKALLDNLRSDHRGQSVDFHGKNEQVEEKVICRPLTQKRLELFKFALVNKIKDLNADFDNPDIYFEALFKLICTHFESIFQNKEINNKSKLGDWATRGILKSKETLYDLYNKRNYTKDTEFVEHVKVYSKIFKQVCSCAKTLYIKNKIFNSSNKIKTTWEVIKKETGKSSVKEKINALKDEDIVIHNKLEIANVFERFFVDIPLKLTEGFHGSSSESPSAEDFLRDNVDTTSVTDTFKFHHVTPTTIIKVFKTLRLKKTEDLWGLSVKVLDTIINCISSHLAKIFNSCVDKGVFPKFMKQSKIIPLHKTGCREDPSNYRPVSILPSLSKIFEKIILNQLLCYFNVNRSLHESQFGFRKGRSTLDAGLKLISYILEAWEDSQDAIGIFCDLSKAFDCVNHKILTMKLKHYGVTENALSLLESYLDNREQRVAIGNIKSSGSIIKLGVPQGSILGPFLFLIYVNDLPFMVQRQTNNEIVLFADDTSLLFKITRKATNFSVINNALELVSKWFSANNLVLNPTKTNCVKFSLANTKNISTDIKLMEKKIDLVNSTKFLGITIDNKLQWGSHIAKLGNKLSSAVYAIREVRKLTDVATARLVYFAYFHSVLSYGILLWGSSADVNSVFVLQKRAIRAMYNLSPRTSLRDLFSKFKILTVHSLYIYENIMYMRKNIHKFKKQSDLHNINTRNKDKLATSTFRLQKTNKSFIGNSIRFYNKIPKDILDLTENRFKNCVKQDLTNKAYYNINDYLNDKNAWSLSASVRSVPTNQLDKAPVQLQP